MNQIENLIVCLHSIIGTVGMIAIKYGCADKMPEQMIDYDDATENPHCLIKYAAMLLEKDQFWTCLIKQQVPLEKTTKLKQEIDCYSRLLESLI